MRLSTAVTLALLALLALGTLGVGFAVGSPASAEPVPTTTQIGEDTSVDAETQQEIRIELSASGDAVWTIDHYYPLESDEDRESFEAFADQVAEGEIDSSYNVTQFAANAEAETGREMAIEDAGWQEPRVEDREDIEALDGDGDVGVLTYSFTWTNFAEQDGRNIHLGDVFNTSDGDTWLPALSETQRLVIVPPSNYGVVDAQQAPSNGLLIWDGPYEFEADELNARYLAGGVAGLSWLEWVAVILLVAAVAGGGYYLAKRRGLIDEDWVAETPLATLANGGENADQSTAPADESTGDVVSYEDEVDLELLSDEERVLRLLRQNGGRMKQASIVTETDWSNAKVSQLLSRMDDDDAINKLRIGRENLITLPEVDLSEIE